MPLCDEMPTEREDSSAIGYQEPLPLCDEMPTEREDSSAIESLVIQGGVKGEGPATNVGSSSAPVGKPIMIPDLNKKTMTKVGLDGAREEGPLKAGADGFAVCDFPTGTVSTEIPNLSLVEFPKKKEKKMKVVLKRPAAQKKRNSKKGGILYCSEDESDSGGGSGESEDARDAVPGAGGEAATWEHHDGDDKVQRGGGAALGSEGR